MGVLALAFSPVYPAPDPISPRFMQPTPPTSPAHSVHSCPLVSHPTLTLPQPLPRAPQGLCLVHGHWQHLLRSSHQLFLPHRIATTFPCSAPRFTPPVQNLPEASCCDQSKSRAPSPGLLSPGDQVPACLAGLFPHPTQPPGQSLSNPSST